MEGLTLFNALRDITATGADVATILIGVILLKHHTRLTVLETLTLKKNG